MGWRNKWCGPNPTTFNYFEPKKKKTGSRKAGNTPSAQRARSKITFCNINAHSIVRKTDFLEALLLGIAPDYVALTETWLTIYIRDAEITQPNYVIVRKDQPTHGGVALLIKKEIPYIVLPDDTEVEGIFCKLSLSGCNIVVSCIYRSTSCDVDVMERLCLYVQNNVLGARLILLGDFILPDVNWQTFQHHSPSADMLFDLCFHWISAKS